METNCISTVDIPCEELYSDIKTDSCDVLSSQCYDFNDSLSIKHNTFSSGPTYRFESTTETCRLKSLQSEAIEDLNSICLNWESERHVVSSLAAVRAVNSKQGHLDLLAMYADSDKHEHSDFLAVYAGNSKQGNSDFEFCTDNDKQKDSDMLEIYTNIGCQDSNTHQIKVDLDDKQQKDVNVTSERLVKCINDETDDFLLSAKTKLRETTDLFKNNFLDQSNNTNCKNNTTSCYKNESVNTLSSWVKIVKTENEALQMFLVDDPNIGFDDENSRYKDLTLKPNTESQFNTYKLLSVRDKEQIPNGEELIVNVPVQGKAPDNESLKSEHVDYKSNNERTQCNTPSRRSLRLKTGKRSAFSYNVSSDDENHKEIEDDVITINALIEDYSKPSKLSNSVLSTGDIKVKLYACDTCSVTCNTAFNLQQHRRTHSTGKSIACKHCNYSCKKNSDMKKHEETHGPQNLHKCTECDYSGKRLRYLKKHMRIHRRGIVFSDHLDGYKSRNKSGLDSHLFGYSNPYRCDECGDSFKLKSSFKEHLASHSNRILLYCAFCVKPFKDKYLLQDHEARHKKDFIIAKTARGDEDYSNTDKAGSKVSKGNVNPDSGEVKIITKSNNLEEEFNKTGSEEQPVILEASGSLKVKRGLIKCTLCSYSCTSKNVLKRHLRRHSDSKPFVCPQCGASFKRKDHLKVHRFTHNNIRPYKCPHCLYGTHRKYRLTLHILTHQTLKPVKCSLCVYSCRRDCELRYHMRNKHGTELEITAEPRTVYSDPGNVVLKCELCNYSCDSQKRLKYHMTRHENKTPHSCTHCDYKCSSRSSLTDHLLQHAGVKPCLCSVCGMAFRNTSRLNRHKLVHLQAKPYGCNFCDFSSRSKYNLKQHTLRHTDQERERRRSKKSQKSKNNNSNSVGSTKQYLPPEVQSLVEHAYKELPLNSGQPQNNVNVMTQEFKSNTKLTDSSFQSTSTPQYFNINQVDTTNHHYKHQDRNMDPVNHNFNNMHQCAEINHYHDNKASCPIALTQAPTYPDPYQNGNPYLAHPHPVSYNTNTGHQNLCYSNRNVYGFSHSYFYNESAIPISINASMSFYTCSSNNIPYSPNPNLTVPIYQNFTHLNPQINQTAYSTQPPVLAPLISAAENQNQSISETEEFHMHSLTLSEDISTDVPESQSNEVPKPLPLRPHAKKTGAVLDNKVIKKNDNENAPKLTHMCSECGYICLTNTMLQRHKTIHIDFKPHKCEDCGKSFKRMDHMKAHKRTHNQDKPYNCKHCTYTCSRKYRLKLHERTHINDSPYSCNVCDSTFDAHTDLEEHSRTHYESFAFSCSKCEFKCEDKTELRFHHETHNTFLCEECSYVCRSSREFNSHKRMHADKEELACSLCSYKCDSQKRLKYHMDRHRNKTPHHCPHCDYTCSSRSSLTDHLLQHEGLKPFLCSACGMRFRNVSRLNRHKMTHTDIKPHTCDYCPFSSRSRYNLKQHLLRHFK